MAWLRVHMIFCHISFCSTMGADVGDSRRKRQSFYMSGFKITVLSQVFRLCSLQNNCVRGNVELITAIRWQSVAQQGSGCEPEVFLLQWQFLTGREMLNQLGWAVFMKCVKVMMKEAHWAMILMRKPTIKCNDTDYMHARQWLICLLWGY